MADELDKLINEIEAEKMTRAHADKQLSDLLKVESTTAERLQQERRNKVADFKLELQLEDDPAYGQTAGVVERTGAPEEHTSMAEDSVTPEETADVTGSNTDDTAAFDAAGNVDAAAQDADITDENEHAPDASANGCRKKRRANKGAWGCVRGIIYAVLVLGISGMLAYFAITGGIDITGLNKSSTLIDITIPEGASTEAVAKVLHTNGLIDQPLIFRLYSKLTKADGTYQPGLFSLSPDMGYGGLIEKLQSAKSRASVSVTITEGMTADAIAKKLEENEVCEKSAFFDALVNENFSEYAFLKDVPQRGADGKFAAPNDGRIYRLEGYLFPDTYEFYTGSSGKNVIKKFLDNFQTKMDTTIQAALKASGMKMDDMIILASIIQGEAANTSEMPRVSRVIHNRLDNPATYPYLQCDATGRYASKLLPQISGLEISSDGYNTYKRKGLPAGPIGNPGIDAIKAAVLPSEEAAYMGCFYFANDSAGNTYYSKTYKEHVAVCRKYGIGIHG